MLDLKLLGEELGALVVSEVARATEPLTAEIAGLKGEVEGLRQIARTAGELLERAEADAADLSSDERFDEALARYFKTRPVVDGIDGLNGRDGIDATDDQIAAAVARWLEANSPADGKDGSDGKDGPPGADGRDGVDGKDGLPGTPGERGLDGKDGVGLAGAIIDREGNLVVTTTAGEAIKLGPVVGRDGSDGINGKDGLNGADGIRGDPGRDGFGLEHFDAALKEDGRTVELSFTQGDERFTVELAVPAMIYRGVFRDGQTYARGDTVTWAGALWHCDSATADKPGEGSKAWTLAVKRGRDGKDGQTGPQGEQGKQGPPGIDRRH